MTQTTHIASASEHRILRMLQDGEWHYENELKSKFSFLQNMYFKGLIVGCGLDDERGCGNSPKTRMWKVKQGVFA